jgi:hypothetical protein
MNLTRNRLLRRESFMPKHLLVFLASLSLLGCTAAAMRIDVEVYKGPLAREPEVQWSEFIGLVNELADSLASYNDATLMVAVHEGYLDPTVLQIATPSLRRLQEKDPSFRWMRTVAEDVQNVSAESQQLKNWCKGKSLNRNLVSKWYWPPSYTPDTYVGCLIMAQLHDDAAQVIGLIDSLRIELQGKPVEQLQQLMRQAQAIKDELLADRNSAQITDSNAAEQAMARVRSAGAAFPLILHQMTAYSDHLSRLGDRVAVDAALLSEGLVQARSGKPGIQTLLRQAQLEVAAFPVANDDFSDKVKQMAKQLGDEVRPFADTARTIITDLDQAGLSKALNDPTKLNELKSKLAGLKDQMTSLPVALQTLEGKLEDVRRKQINLNERARRLETILLPGKNIPSALRMVYDALSETHQLVRISAWPPSPQKVDELKRRLNGANRVLTPRLQDNSEFMPGLVSDFNLAALNTAIQTLSRQLDQQSVVVTQQSFQAGLEACLVNVGTALEETEIIAKPWRDARDLRKQAAGEMTKRDRKRLVEKAAEVAMQLKTKAFYWAGSHTSSAPGKRTVRASVVNFANLASEYSNQLGARADSLLKQMNGHDRKELPLSVHLRDAESTDFGNLYVWNRAVALPLFEDVLYHPSRAFTSQETRDRVRAFERLFGDFNWSHINTVYASGQGTTRMALIKDDIGNWNLKSFASDPSEILQAYTDLTKAALKAAADAASNAAAPGAGAGLQKTIDLASRFASGQFGDPKKESGNVNFSALHDRVVRQLKQLEQEAKDPKKSSDTVLEEAHQILKNYTSVLEALSETTVPPQPVGPK